MYLDIGSGKTRFTQAKMRNGIIHEEARAVDRAKLYKGNNGMLKFKPRKPKRKGHHGWRLRSIG